MKNRPTRGRRTLAALAVALSFGAVTSIAAAGQGGSPSLPGHRTAAATADTAADDPLLGPIDTTKTQPDAKLIARLKKQAAAAGGAVNVIVGLRMRFVPEGLLDDKGVQAQHDQIASLQSMVLMGLNRDTYGIARQYDTVPYLALSVSPAALDALATNEAVATVTADALYSPSLFTSVPQVEGDEARGFGFIGSGQTVAVIDTGVDRTHPMLSGRVLSEACFALRSQFLWITSGDCGGGAASAQGAGTGAPCTATTGLDCSHGTHVAGIAAGSGNGTTLPSGVAPGANIISIQVFHRENDPGTCAAAQTSAPCLLTRESDIIAALNHVFSLRNIFNIASVNLSLGGGAPIPLCDFSAEKPAIDNLRSVNIATVAAAGNNGSPVGQTAPGCISTAISVGAVDSTDTVASFSNSSQTLQLLAPGVSITSSVPGGGLGSKSGTSMATPHVTGAFAVLRQAMPGASVATLQNLLRQTGRPITDPRNGVVTPRIRILTALAQLGLLRRSGESFRQTVPVGGLASNGIGLATRMGGSLSGTIQISGVPNLLGQPQAAVTKAFLYWSTIGGSDATVSFNGTSVTGTLLGATPDTDWGLGANRVYRADVTGLVAPGGNGSYSFSGLNPAFGGDGQGASLVLAWTKPGRYLLPPRGPQSTQVIVDGAQEIRPAGPTAFGHLFTSLGVFRTPSSAALHLGIGDGQVWPEQPVSFANTAVTGANPFSGTDGPGWDDQTISLPTSLLPGGTSQAGVNLATVGDALLWSYSGLELQQ
jgi:subtilisin